MCLTVFLHHLSPSPLWYTSWSGTLCFILHTFLHPIIVFFLQHMPIPSQPVSCSTKTTLSIPSLSLNSLLETLSFTLTSHIHLTILISARWSTTSFSFLTGQVSLPCNILLRTQTAVQSPSHNNQNTGTRKVKSNLDLMEQERVVWQWHQLGHMLIYTSSRLITKPAPHHSVFNRPDAQPTVSMHIRHSLPLIMNHTFILISNGTICLNFFHPIRTLVSTAASAWHSSCTSQLGVSL